MDVVQASRKRIEFIDLAKGICIILVLFAHLESYAGLSLPMDEYIKIFRMPLYYFLSGLFFKEYEGFVSFLKRKTNKLLIPFVAFFLLTSIGIPFITCLLHHRPVKWILLWSWIISEEMYNPPIWFLWSLFWINCIFYIVKICISRFFREHVSLVVCMVAVCLGTCGFMFGHCGINVPAFFDTTLTAFPFFVVGNIVCRRTVFLRQNRYDRYNWIFVILLLCMLVFLKDGSVDYRSNAMDASFITVYICGFSGLLAILLLSKTIGKLPIISYYGRYSIMILVTHMVLLAFVYDMLGNWIKNLALLFILTFLVVCLCYLVIIPVMIKYLGHITAQKDVIKI